MSIITPLVDTLISNVLGRRGDVERVAARQAEQPLGGVSRITSLRDPTSDTPDDRIDQRAGISSNSPRTNQGEVARNPQLRGTQGHVSSGAAENAGQTQNSSSRTHLSAEARTIARILEKFPVDTQAVKSSQALTRSEPTASRLSTALSGQVRHSGLFYESHLSQWLKGNYDVGELLREPQGKLARLVAMPASGQSTAGQSGAAQSAAGQSGTAQSAAGRPAATAALPATGFASPLPSAATAFGQMAQPGIPMSSSHLLMGQMAQSGTVLPSTQLPGGQTAAIPQSPVTAQLSPLIANHGSTAERAAQLAQVAARGEALMQLRESADTHNAATQQRSAAEPVHDSLQGLLRHQLEMLTQPLFRWEGFFMPDMPMRWELEEESAGGEVDDDALRIWRSRLHLDMPQLGAMDIEISLQGGTLHVSGEVDESSLALVRRQGGGLATRLEAAGLPIASMNFSPRSGSETSDA
ncbi:flagellar hook-length control protein FliK [Kushneria aurantia]|uniref:Flagellar hook-length control protein FliK n=1 Tax=Kushneria aurantia TaxID=504092 RepID=A0ABV6G117_9GAMM|nr:flagellar hook-length control protein FliK [Kushneria aurantia]